MPPVRDEESETQRKAHAKRVRETRRSTQGVTLEDLKSAEQLVKKKQQQENQQRTSELQQLVASQQQKSSPTPPTVSTVASSHTGKQIVLYGFLREINFTKFFVKLISRKIVIVLNILFSKLGPHSLELEKIL